MVPKTAFEAVDSVLRDIRQNDLPFGGVTVVVGGDFRQTLPIVERGPTDEIIEACVVRSPLWPCFELCQLKENIRTRHGGQEWQQYLLKTGAGDDVNEQGRTPIPPNLICKGDIIDEMYGPSISPSDVEQLATIAILAPKNIDVDAINRKIIDRFNVSSPLDEKHYKSIDEVDDDERHQASFYPVEYLNT